MTQPTAALHHFAIGPATLTNHSVISDLRYHSCTSNAAVCGNPLHTRTHARTAYVYVQYMYMYPCVLGMGMTHHVLCLSAALSHVHISLHV